MTLRLSWLISLALVFGCSADPAKPSTASQSAAPPQTSSPVVDPLPSWNNGNSKQAILGFVARVTKEGSSDFVPVAERIATFDNDGTLWSEQPMYFQLAFAIDRVKALAPQHPEWKDKQPFKSVLENDMKAARRERRGGHLRHHRWHARRHDDR